MSDYEATHKAGWANVPEPKPLPTGHYTLKVDAVFYNEREGDKADMIQPRYVPVKPEGDVDQREIKALGPDYDFSVNEITHAGTALLFWGNAKQKRKVIKHFEMLGADIEELNKHDLTVDGDDGSKRLNPEVSKLLRDKLIVAKITGDSYQGEHKDIASDFVPVKA